MKLLLSIKFKNYLWRVATGV